MFVMEVVLEKSRGIQAPDAMTVNSIVTDLFLIQRKYLRNYYNNH